MSAPESKREDVANGSLADREARLRAILDTAVEGIVTIDERGVVESINPAAISMFGYSEEEVVGSNVSLLMPSPYREEHDDYIRKYLDTRQPRIIGTGREVVGRRKNGETFPMHLSVSEVPLSTGRIFTGFIHDLTARVVAEKQATRLGQILEDSLNEVYMFDATTLRFTNVNRGARDNLGYSMQELRELTPLSLKKEISQAQFDELVAPLRQGEKREVIFETTHYRRDGSTYPAEVHLQLEENQESPLFVAIVLDISERKRFQEELERLVDERTRQLESAQEELVRKERLAILGQLAGGVAHEIRNPLGVIRNATYFLRQVSPNDDEDISESFEEIERALASSNKIVGELLDYARERQPSPEANFSAKEAVDNAASMLNVGSGIEIVRVGEDDLRCFGDLGQVERILLNLMNNAIQAMPKGGQLRIEYHREGKAAIFRVADTGIGIDDEHLERIFDPLFTQKAKGIGLGLAISRRYAELNAGEIQVVSELGEGSTFQLILPLAKVLPQEQRS